MRTFTSWRREVSSAASLPERLRAHADLLGVYTDTDAVVADLREAADEIDKLWSDLRKCADSLRTAVRQAVSK